MMNGDDRRARGMGQRTPRRAARVPFRHRDAWNRRRRALLGLESLEARAVPATITVTSNADDPTVDQASLRAAITSMNLGSDANLAVTANRTGAYGTDDTIRFSINGGSASPVDPSDPVGGVVGGLLGDGGLLGGVLGDVGVGVGDVDVGDVDVGVGDGGDVDVGVGDGDDEAEPVVRTIALVSALPTIAVPVTIDGYSQPGARPNTLAAGSDAVLLIVLDGSGLGISASNFGLTITAADCVIRGLVINQFGGSAVYISGAGAAGNVVAGNYLGTNAAGTADLGNGYGVRILGGATGNTIGGAAPGARNLISGNGTGVMIQGAEASGNVVAGNFFGTDASGATDLGNGTGVFIIEGATNNTVGGTAPGARNLISGNDTGVDIAAGATENLVAGNFLGTDAAGTAALANTIGVHVRLGATNNVVGGAAPGARNLISGNTWGVQIQGARTGSNVVSGNFIGTDAAGAAALTNGTGVHIFGGATNTTVGGTTPGARNVISGNTTGVLIQDAGTSGNTVAGNYLGTDATGTAPLANGTGVHIRLGATNNTVGGTTAGARNVISGNDTGVAINAAGGNTVAGNLIGTDAAGTAPLANGIGVWIVGGATGNTVGGTAPAARNLISGNDFDGVRIEGAGTSGNVVAGNFLGTDATGTAPLGNGVGVSIVGGATSNTVGGTAPGARNVISGNIFYGVVIEDLGTSGNTVAGNFIGTNAAGAAPLANGSGVFIFEGATDNTVGGTTPGARNLIAGNNFAGVWIEGVGTTGNVIAGNFLGTDDAGAAPLANDYGVLIAGGAMGNTVGGTAPDARNLISGNDVVGVQIAGAGTSGNTVAGNFLGTDATGAAPLGNSFFGVAILGGATGNTVGGTTPDARNLIAGNGTGVQIQGAGTSGNAVAGNFLGTDAAGTTPLDNGTGVAIVGGATDNLIGGTTPDARNLISGNTFEGVRIEGAGTSGNVVAGNYLGTDADGTASLANGTGVAIQSGATGNTVGGTTPDARNLISGNTFEGVRITGAGTSGNTVAGNFLGTDAAGTAPLANGTGVVIDAGATNNLVGGTAPGARNLISGNAVSGNSTGVWIQGAGTSGNTVAGNLIGTNADGNAALGNANGVVISAGATDNTIGGTAPGARNLISGNGTGVFIDEPGTSGNTVAGNFIGTDAAGAAELGNENGVVIQRGATGNTIGGTDPGARNLISGNENGVGIFGAGTSHNVVAGNFLGTDASGAADLGNVVGVFILGGATDNAIGGTAPGARNLISGNGTGVLIAEAETRGNAVAGNFIGTTADGAAELGNGTGVVIDSGATNNLVGGTAPGARNLIAGNGPGVLIRGAGTSGNTVAGNFIGTNADGAAPLFNDFGVAIAAGATNNTVGGTTPGARNLISSNGTGVLIHGSGTSGNTVAGNFIGTDAAGDADLGNIWGVLITAGAADNTIGDTAPGARNLISGNGTGVLIQGAGTSGNTVAGNFIGTAVDGTTPLANATGVVIQGGATNNVIGGTVAGAGNVISGNDADGVLIADAGTTGNRVLGNRIGVAADGLTPLGNGNFGVFIDPGAADNAVGGIEPGSGNVIVFNLKGVVVGIDPADVGAVGNSILGNSIFGNTTIGIDLGNDGPTPNGVNPRAFPNDGQNYPVLVSASGTTVTGTLASAPNASYRLEFFATPAGSPDQGQIFLGFVEVTTDANGHAAFTATLATSIPAGTVVTATATNTATDDTSEFSAALNPAIAIDPASLAAGTVLSPYQQTITATGGTGPYTFTVDAGALPDGLALDPSTGVLSGPPTAPGQFSFTVTATDSLGDHNGLSYTLTINPAILLAPPALPVLTVGSPFSLTATAVGGSGGPYTFVVTAGALPAGLGLDPSTGVLSGAPTAAGPYQFTVTATAAGGDTGAQSYSGTVHAAIDVAPAIMPALTVGDPFGVTATATGGSGGPYTFTVTAGALPGGLTLDPSTGLIGGVPLAPGPYSFTVTAVATGGDTGLRSYSGTVDAAIDVTPAILPALTVGSPFSVTAAAVGGGGPYTFAVTAGALPAGLALDPNTGLISGTPAEAGPYQFSVTAIAADGGTGSRAFSGVISPADATPPIPPPSVSAPVVQSLQRFGFHAQRTVLVLTFNTALDPARAQDVSNYALSSIGRRGRRPRLIPLAAAVYDPARATVTLTPAARNLKLRRSYLLKINGTTAAGVAALSGTRLDGLANGLPGSNYTLVFGREVLAGPNRPAHRMLMAARPGLRGGTGSAGLIGRINGALGALGSSRIRGN